MSGIFLRVREQDVALLIVWVRNRDAGMTGTRVHLSLDFAKVKLQMAQFHA